jgi:hypothetical protein
MGIAVRAASCSKAEAPLLRLILFLFDQALVIYQCQLKKEILKSSFLLHMMSTGACCGVNTANMKHD